MFQFSILHSQFSNVLGKPGVSLSPCKGKSPTAEESFCPDGASVLCVFTPRVLPWARCLLPLRGAAVPILHSSEGRRTA